MTIYKVKVKWNKEVYSDIELNTGEPPVLFKAQLYALTGVEPNRQKVMFKGIAIKDDNWNNIQLKDGITILLMGTRESLPEAPKQQTVFVEDMSESELSTALQYPSGLTNLGNTCYINATVQCLRTVPELKQVLRSYLGGLSLNNDSQDMSENITLALRDLYESMDKSATIAPLILLHVLHLAFPRFAEKAENGGFVQQDANECWTELMRMLQQKLKSVKLQNNSIPFNSFVEQYFGGTFQVEMKCNESESEPSILTTENFLQLSCFISTDVKYLQSGLKLRLQETLTKFSPTLNRDSQYDKISKISRLPAYLTIQFVRFFYKERGSVNAKILKDVKFSLNLDVYELCTPELQLKLNPMRNKFKEFEDKKLEESAKDVDNNQNDKSVEKLKHPYYFDDDIGSNNSGYYELQAVLTHKGRSSSSGHYVAWIKRKTDQWFKCDDDTVSLVTSDEILKLSGGGDWHCAYVLLYGPRILETDKTSV